MEKELINKYLKLKNIIIEDEFDILEKNEKLSSRNNESIQKLELALCEISNKDFSNSAKINLSKYLFDYFNLVNDFKNSNKKDSFISRENFSFIHKSLKDILNPEKDISDLHKAVISTWHEREAVSAGNLKSLIKKEMDILNDINDVNFTALYNYVDESWDRLVN